MLMAFKMWLIFWFNLNSVTLNCSYWSICLFKLFTLVYMLFWNNTTNIFEVPKIIWSLASWMIQLIVLTSSKFVEGCIPLSLILLRFGVNMDMIRSHLGANIMQKPMMRWVLNTSVLVFTPSSLHSRLSLDTRNSRYFLVHGINSYVS